VASRISRLLEIDIGVLHEARGRLQIGVDEGLGRAAFDAGEGGGAGRHHHVAAEDEIGAAIGDADGGKLLRSVGDANMAHDRAVLLRQPGEVECRAALAVDMGGHAEQGADGDDAGAADPGDEDVVGFVERRRRRQWQVGEELARIHRRVL
jgi:hypothetical protein